MKNFIFKKFPQDFIVEEKLYTLPKWNGGAFYVFFEKKNKTTFDIVMDLMKRFWLKRNHIWIAGLKDKVWITRQWLSIYKRNLNSIWWKDVLLKYLSRSVRILRTSSDERLLTMWNNKWNLFFIRLRDISNRQRVIDAIEQIKITWVPNFFWEQRFGASWKNWKTWKDIVLWKTREFGNKIETWFKIQAFSSYLFNNYVDQRIKAWTFDKPVTWDIFQDGYKLMVLDKKENYKNIAHDQKWYTIRNNFIDKESLEYIDSAGDMIPTGPVYWYNLFMSWDFVVKWKWIDIKYMSTAMKYELDILKFNWLKLEDLDKFQQFDVFGLRRAIKINPHDIRYKFDDRGDLLIMFELPSWSYASVVIDYIDQLVG